MITFGEKIKDLRKEKTLTQKEMAQALSITVSTLSHWECDYQEPSFKDVVMLANYFDVSTDYLLGKSDDFGNISVKTETAPAHPKESQELLDIFDSLDKFHQVQVLEYARYFSMRENATKNKKG